LLLSKFKPGVPKRALLFIAGALWSFGGGMLLYRGNDMTHEAHFPLAWTWGIGVLLGVLFWLLLFARISMKHSRRIFSLKVDRPCLFAFFSVKSYLMMLIMISAGVFMRKTGAVDPLLVGVFYIIMGTPLLLSSLRFWYFGLMYNKFITDCETNGEQPMPQQPRWQRRLRNFLAVSVVLMVLLIAFTNYWVVHKASPYICTEIASVPPAKVALVPGTSNKMASGHTNMFFQYRLQAAAELYKAGKIHDIIVSGDNGTMYYNEPLEMKKALIDMGIPDSVIYLDYAGFRTFDSVIRAWKIFGQKNFIFVSQRFQNERAVFIGRKFGIEIIAYNAKDVTKYSGFKTNVREIFARVKVFLDIYILNKQPRFLGDPVTIE
jgi:SanA protein